MDQLTQQQLRDISFVIQVVRAVESDAPRELRSVGPDADAFDVVLASDVFFQEQSEQAWVELLEYARRYDRELAQRPADLDQSASR